jgi:hypothetical protein
MTKRSRNSRSTKIRKLTVARHGGRHDDSSKSRSRSRSNH